MTVNGTGFVLGSSVVNWNGSSRHTTFVTSSRLTAKILYSDIAKPSTAAVTVVNSGPGGGKSNVVLFDTTTPATVIPGLAATNLSTGQFPISVAVGDFNKDGKIDLAVANLDSNDVTILLGNGNGTFRSGANYCVGSNPYSVAMGDLNGDGNLDLVVANSGSNDVSVLLGKGNGSFETAVNYSTGPGSSPLSAVLADLNRDGNWSAEQHLAGILGGDHRCSAGAQLLNRRTDSSVYTRFAVPKRVSAAEEPIT